MKGIDSYHGASKEDWRGWKWNVLSRGRQRWELKNDIVLYLPGPKDIDRELAIKRGFANHNLIAVDIDESRVKSIRRNGGLAICASLQRVLLNWPNDIRIDIVDADLCAGLNRDAMSLVNCLCRSPATDECIVSVNMMRGRDADSNELRLACRAIDEQLRFAPERLAYPKIRSTLNGRSSFMNDYKHRGRLLISHIGAEVLKAMTLAAGTALSEDEVVSEAQLHMHWMYDHAHYNSYMSDTGQVFDSVVFLWSQPTHFLKEMAPERFPCGSAVAATLTKRVSLSRIANRDANVKGRIAATLAHRTRRLTRTEVGAA